MATIAWLHLCETAFVDNCDRLCLIGVTHRFPVPALPVAVHHVMLAGRVVDARPGEEIEVSVAITTPSGLSSSPNDPHCIEISNVGEYVLVTLRQLPLHEEGIYRFEVSLGERSTVTLAIPVLMVSRAAPVQVH